MAPQYSVSIDGGEGGEKMIPAPTLEAAKKEAVAWAEQGLWPQDRGELWANVWICNIYDEEDSELLRVKVALGEAA